MSKKKVRKSSIPIKKRSKLPQEDKTRGFRFSYYRKSKKPGPLPSLDGLEELIKDVNDDDSSEIDEKSDSDD